MQKVTKIVNLVLKILAIVVLGLVVLLTLFMAYIMIAPDELPKPFRLVYQYNANSPSLSSDLFPVSTPVVPLPTITPTLKPVQPGEGLMVNMSTKIINLADPSGRKYIKLTVALEFTPEENATPEKKSAESTATPNSEQLARITARMPLMDDMVITILSTKTYEQLYTAEGKEMLRKEILETINKRLPELHLISVYFTEFVVQ